MTEKVIRNRLKLIIYLPEGIKVFPEEGEKLEIMSNDKPKN